MIIMVSLIKLVFNQTTNALPLYMDRDLEDDSLYGITIILNQIVAIGVTPFLNYLAYYFTEYEMFMISGCIASISPLLFLFGPSYYAVFWFVIFAAIGEALLLLIIVQYSLKIAPVGKEGVIITVINISIYVSLYIAGILNGVLLNEYCPDEGEREC